ncbi:HSP20 family molecular chaperone IbpA [Thermolongibacillus altinsuensis]|uniref:HSP20 family molecular chaperone IbpA n=1 Tax=Thermolongibacillus altinsuensis TaxID=575256 RepID=A0A4R1QI15_9BACL|nr:HSP20 family molecular chaperone IbpA [Thermolongibacillus altinsuensis]GMB07924.1 hypothetical protein B1no1_06340 [Thermolongibacillus altinsuensis]
MLSNEFQPPMKKKKDVSHMLDSFFDDRPLKKLLHTLDEYVHRTFSPLYIPIDVHETSTEHVIIAHLPSVKREQIQLQFDEERLILSISHQERIETIDEQGNLFQKKEAQQHITKSIFLPYPVSEKEVQASFQDGKLVIRLPQKKKYIDID